MITEQGIKSALRGAVQSGKNTIELKDDGNRGEGRLVLVIGIRGERVTSEFYAVWYADDKRRSVKIGNYPTLTLVDARAQFRKDYSPAIARGEPPKGPRARREREAGDTVTDLFEGYAATITNPTTRDTVRNLLLGVSSATEANPDSWQAKRRYPWAAKVLGPNKRAEDVTPEDIIKYLSGIFARGAITHAETARVYVSCAFNWAIKGSHSYHIGGGGKKWALTLNPAAAIARNPDAIRPGQRNLTPHELRHFWAWLDAGAGRHEGVVDPGIAPLKLAIATGQRPGEMLCLTPSAAVMEAALLKDVRLGVFDPAEKLLYWPKTKNGHPHSTPVPSQAAAVLGALTPSDNGLYFPHRIRPWQTLDISSVESTVNRYLKAHPEVAHFTPRDLRRTWKTLSGRAGISKEWRDRLQNHALGDVASKHYDRYDYLPERRAAMKTWESYLDRILGGEIDMPVAILERTA